MEQRRVRSIPGHSAKYPSTSGWARQSVGRLTHFRGGQHTPAQLEYLTSAIKIHRVNDSAWTPRTGNERTAACRSVRQLSAKFKYCSCCAYVITANSKNKPLHGWFSKLFRTSSSPSNASMRFRDASNRRKFSTGRSPSKVTSSLLCARHMHQNGANHLKTQAT
jgi:hypothetical protein